MEYKMSSNTSLTDAAFSLKLKQGAKLYSEYVDSELLFIFSDSKNSEYEYYEVHFGKENFMHLAGIKSKILSAKEFYKVCLESQQIDKRVCTPSHDAKTMYAKVTILPELLDLRNGKLYKMGEKNVVTRENDFEVAVGNRIGIVGFDHRVSANGSKRVNKTVLPIPTTLLTNPITDYCTRPKKIIFILKKDAGSSLYNSIFYEIKKNIFKEECVKIIEDLKKQIMPKLYT